MIASVLQLALICTALPLLAGGDERGEDFPYAYFIRGVEHQALKGGLRLNVLRTDETIHLLGDVVISMPFFWCKEGQMVQYSEDEKFSSRFKRIAAIIDREGCTPRGKASQNAFERLVAEKLRLRPVAPDWKEDRQAALEWLRMCHLVVADTTLDANQRSLAAIWGMSRCFEWSRDFGYLGSVQEALNLLRAVRLLKHVEPVLTLELTNLRSRALLYQGSRIAARDVIAELLTEFADRQHWNSYKVAKWQLRWLSQK